MDSSIKHFPCDTIDKALLASEWRKWVRSVKFYLDAEEITDVVKRKNKLLHFGGPQLQEIAFELPGAIAEYDPETNIDVFKILVDALENHFSPQQNSCFERHGFRNMKPEEGENLNKFLIKIRSQANKCCFGRTEQEAREISIKDKLIDTWAPVDLKRKLLEKELSLDEVIAQCQIYEQTKNQSNIMQNKVISQPDGITSHINRLESSRKRKLGRNLKELECIRCGNNHHPSEHKNCPALNIKCHQCGRIGHFARKCRTAKGNRQIYSNTSNFRPSHKIEKGKRVHLIDEAADSDESPSTSGRNNFECFRIKNSAIPIEDSKEGIISVKIGNIPINMLIDSGASCNVVSGQDWEKLCKNNVSLVSVEEDVKSNIKAYASDEPLKIKCKFTAPICVGNNRESIQSFLVVEHGTISLLGKEASISLGVLKLGLMGEINNVEKATAFPKIKDVKVKLTIDHSVKPVQQPLRRIPVAVESKVEKKLKEALDKDIIEEVNGYSPWISPMVIVFKPNGDIRICIDMRRANEAIHRENFPLPTFESFMTKLSKARYFSRLDLTNAYHQLELEEESRPITTFISHKGLFRYKRLLFGINSAPEIFQRTFQNMLAKCKNCLNYLDDVIVYGKTEEEHNKNLKDVLRVLKNYNVQLNEKKCHIKTERLEFLGHILSSSGIEPDPQKIEVIRTFKAPTNKEEVRSFLGLVTYLCKFISNLGDLTEPLRHLLKKETKFQWGQLQQDNFEMLKEELAKLPTLAYFSLQRRTQLVADASPIALGAVLLQFDENNEPQVISFASKSLTPIERRYSQTEKESLALVWATERFYFYLAGIEFELVTDHKPLEVIFKPTSKPPARIERWLLRLQSFKFKVIYKSGKSNIADPLSRLCKLRFDKTFDEPNEHHVQCVIKEVVPRALSISEVIAGSKKDPEIVEAIRKLAGNTWETNDMNAYYPFRLELTFMGPILLRGNKLIIPQIFRNRVLELAHEGHPGETVMKRRIRSKIWWPRIDRECEKHVKRCRECVLVGQPNKPAPMSRQQLPAGPWQYLALDYMSGEQYKEHLLVLIDYYSRYVEAIFTKSTSSAAVIRALEEVFCRLGLPKMIKVDNATNFNSQEMKNFCITNNIELVNSPPYWPQANGEVENINKSLKKRLQISYVKGDQDYKKEMMAFLMMYNTTPHGTTGKSPTELLFNRKIRDKLPCIEDIVVENLNDEVYDRDLINKEKGREKEDNRRRATINDIKKGDRVFLKNTHFPNKLTPNFDKLEYTVLDRNGNELTLFGNGKVTKRNVAHVKKVPCEEITPETISSPLGNTGSTTDDVQRSNQGNLDLDTTSTIPNLPPLRLVKKGGMWRPATDESC